MGVYCLSLQMVVRARTWGSIACLYKWWSEPGHGGLLSCLYNNPSIANFNTSTPALNRFILDHFNLENFECPV